MQDYLTTSSQPDRQASLGCHVVSVGFSTASDELIAECPSLPDEVVTEIPMVDVTADARARLARHVRSLVDRHALPGIAVVWNATPFPRSGDEANLSPPCLYLKPPPPILVPFEPIELSERDPRIAAICDVDTSNGESRSVPSTRWPLSYARTLGIFALLATALFVSAALGIALSFSESTLWIALLLAVPSVITMVLLGIRGHWFLVPRGVVIRSTFMRVSLRRYAPSDSVLIVYPLPPGWGATLFQGSRQSGRFLSRRECIALLRVWQCPRPTPAIEIMDDLK